MKSIKSKLAIIAATLSLGAGLAVAQDQTAPPPGPKHEMHRRFKGGPEFGMFLRQLNLTEDQKAQVKQIFQGEKTTIKPLMQQERTAREQLAQLITSGSFDQGKASAIATQESQTHLQFELEHAKVASQIYQQVLTSEQKAKVSQILAQHQQRMQERMQKQEQSAPWNQ
ncbi:MAG TPA: periplasmic heavy metal sensor [Terriglobales bacterium]|nr:periplasmic heavy metal sensor [Terriglobales bacterium]